MSHFPHQIHLKEIKKIDKFWKTLVLTERQHCLNNSFDLDTFNLLEVWLISKRCPCKWLICLTKATVIAEMLIFCFIEIGSSATEYGCK